jgi:hypothetical protein
LFEQYCIGEVTDEDQVSQKGAHIQPVKKWTKNVSLKAVSKVSHNVSIFTFKFCAEDEGF